MPTKIEWCDETWSPVTGCSPVSPGCKECWAERMAKRLRGRFGYPADEPFRVTFHRDRLDQPLRWKKPRRIFVASMGDLFHKDVTSSCIQRIWDKMWQADWHTFLVLTKRPERMYEYVNEPRNIPMYGGEGGDWPLPNVWLGTSCENQATADERIPHLLRCRAAVRFISLEPMLGPVDVRLFETMIVDEREPAWGGPGYANSGKRANRISWLICGAESIGSRPGRECKIEWIESAVEQAKAAGIPAFVKQVHLRIDGKLRLVKDVFKFPKHLQVQEYPG